MSIAGSAFHGYCFAFHLINIVNNNQLLSGVIQAVTQNGEPRHPGIRPLILSWGKFSMRQWSQSLCSSPRPQTRHIKLADKLSVAKAQTSPAL